MSFKILCEEERRKIKIKNIGQFLEHICIWQTTDLISVKFGM